MRTRKRRIDVADGVRVSSAWAVPDDFRGGAGSGVILAHGAGSDMGHPFMVHVHAGIGESGFLAVRFNFPYAEEGKRAPDPAGKLIATWGAVVDRVRKDRELSPKSLVLGGKSMGGRIASHLVAAGAEAAGLLFLGYPLHPPNRPEKLRVEHLRDIRCPMLFIQGSRDTLCRLDLLEQQLKNLPAPINLHVIDDADHSFRVPKRTGRSQESIWDEIVNVAGAWIRTATAG